jgi:hypothetical protein
MVLAYSALTRGSLKGFRIWILSTAILGMTFLAFQTFEFRDFANHETVVRCADQDVDTMTALEKKAAEKSKQAVMSKIRDAVVTEILPLRKFYPAEQYHQDYFRMNPNAPYFAFVISPKLKKMEKVRLGK